MPALVAAVGSSGPETVKTYTGNACYVLKSVLNDLSGSAVAQALTPDFGGGSRRSSFLRTLEVDLHAFRNKCFQTSLIVI